MRLRWRRRLRFRPRGFHARVLRLPTLGRRRAHELGPPAHSSSTHGEGTAFDDPLDDTATQHCKCALGDGEELNAFVSDCAVAIDNNVTKPADGERALARLPASSPSLVLVVCIIAYQLAA